MPAFLITVDKGVFTYRAVIIDDILYRREGSKIGTWRLYGGAIKGVDFEEYIAEDFPQSPFERECGHHVEGLGKYEGKKLKEIAKPVIQEGDTLIVSPIDSSRARELDIDLGTTAILSGIVKKILNIEKVDDTIFNFL